jgi:hypothetical protein
MREGGHFTYSSTESNTKLEVRQQCIEHDANNLQDSTGNTQQQKFVHV